MADDLLRWIDTAGITEVSIVSPHLDDAAFSTAGLLLSPLAPRCCVVTVFSEAAADADPAWAAAAGFASPAAEHAARRQEDAGVLSGLRVRFEHLGQRPGPWSPGDASELAARVLAPTSPRSTAQTLVLLPAAAGGEQLPGAIARGIARLARRPLGAPAHPEHRQVRDGLLPSLLASGVRVGFYSEFPYLWNERPGALASRLAALAGRRLAHYALRVKLPQKMALAQAYRSQLVPVLGAKAAWRERVLDRAEEYFIVDDGRSAPASA